jgi:chorismate mutase
MTIAGWRRKIDELDRALVRLLSRRARCSLTIGRLKRAAGMRLFHHAREREIARNVARANRGPLPDGAVQHLFEEILRVTRATVRESLRAESRRAKRRKSG